MLTVQLYCQASSYSFKRDALLDSASQPHTALLIVQNVDGQTRKWQSTRSATTASVYFATMRIECNKKSIIFVLHNAIQDCIYILVNLYKSRNKCLYASSPFPFHQKTIERLFICLAAPRQFQE
jgi:hypothetical protein